MMLTERAVRTALALHRVALAAKEVQHLPSPATPCERNAKGAADPTAGIVLDPRRVAVADALRDAERAAERLTSALDAWDGRK